MITPAVAATVLVDGFVRGTWTITGGGAAALRIRPFGRLGGTEREALRAEAESLLAFARPDQPGEVRVD